MSLIYTPIICYVFVSSDRVGSALQADRLGTPIPDRPFVFPLGVRSRQGTGVAYIRDRLWLEPSLVSPSREPSTKFMLGAAKYSGQAPQASCLINSISLEATK